jgi:type 1 glutamine amidotransferase
MKRIVFSALCLSLLFVFDAAAADKLKLLIVDGQNNHNWKATTPILKQFLTASDRFDVTVVTSPPNKADAAEWEKFNPDFTKFQVVLSNYNGELWPEGVRKNFEQYVSNGGGVVIVHAANNAFPQWDEFNRMIGLGWRGANFGDRVTVENDGKLIRTAKNQGPGAGHGSQHEFSIVTRDKEHPVMKNLPAEWMHAKDELYHGQRGPALDMHLLATAYSDKKTGGTDAHEPMVWWIPYGKGKVFTTVMGHAEVSMKCVGFQAVVARGSEWVATNQVTLPIPAKFPTTTTTSVSE